MDDITHGEQVGGGNVIITWEGDGIIAWTDHKHLLSLLGQQKVSDNFTKPSAGFIYVWEHRKATET